MRGAMLTQRLKPFMEHNPESAVKDLDGGFVVERPWGDETLEFRCHVPGERPPEVELDRAIETLNSVRLPPSFSALWHRDSGDLEFIFTTSALDPEYRDRTFTFRYGERNYQCAFGRSSSRLLDIAKMASPVGPQGVTNHRNLLPFHFFRPDRAEEGERPSSFWVRGYDLEGSGEEEAVAFSRHLNFHMRYFDRRSPVTMIHTARPELRLGAQTPRYIRRHFPEVIQSRRFDPTLLSLWENTLEHNHLTAFIHCYQILEYSAFYHLRASLHRDVRRILIAPDTPSRADAAAGELLEIITNDRVSDEDKINLVVLECTNPDELWELIEAHSDYFENEIEFDGGFVLPPLIRPGCDRNEFRAMWHPKFPDTIRRIRNALVHARESRTSKVITPTSANETRLHPWLPALSLVAAQVIMYGNQPARSDIDG